MSGELFVVGTPIGNLGDLSPRGLETLTNCDCAVFHVHGILSAVWAFNGDAVAFLDSLQVNFL